MPWLAYEFKDNNKIKHYLDLKQNIKGLPCLILIDPQDGKYLSNTGRSDVETMEPVDCWLKWNESKVQ